MWIGVVSLFPQMIQSLGEYGVLGRGIRSGLVDVECWNPRDYTLDVHRTVDDRPYGGGPGMLMKVEPLKAALDAAKQAAPDPAKLRTIYVSPQGRRLDQAGVEELSREKSLLFLAGRYEGVDERLLEAEVDEEWSLGDFVLSGGELAVMAMIDAIARFIPGVLGHEMSAKEDSFAAGLLDCPHYTRPEVYSGHKVPSVLLSGNHEEIRKWRLKQALGRTWLRRPDLLEQQELDPEQKALLDQFIKESARS